MPTVYTYSRGSRAHRLGQRPTLRRLGAAIVSLYSRNRMESRYFWLWRRVGSHLRSRVWPLSGREASEGVVEMLRVLDKNASNSCYKLQ
jgi:hypothetical protein